MTRLEVCVDSAEGLETAIASGADRIELCSALELGGLTPTPGLMRLAAETGVAVRTMIRPRAGDFVFGPADIRQMLADIETVRNTGLEGVVLGASRADGTLDIETLRTLAQASEGMGRTLHRAFDLVPNLSEAIEVAIDLGFDTVLTSGRAASAIAGLADLVEAHRLAGERIAIMPGSGVNAATAVALLAAAPFPFLHGSCSAAASPDSAVAISFGFVSPNRRKTRADLVVALKAALAAQG